MDITGLLAYITGFHAWHLLFLFSSTYVLYNLQKEKHSLKFVSYVAFLSGNYLANSLINFSFLSPYGMFVIGFVLLVSFWEIKNLKY
mgnify:CR=1 FL=1